MGDSWERLQPYSLSKVIHQRRGEPLEAPPAAAGE